MNLTQDEMLLILSMINEDRTSSEERARMLTALGQKISAALTPAPQIVRWEQHGTSCFVDVANVGRYLVRRNKRHSREFVATLNAKGTTFRGTRDQVIAMVERTIRALEMQAGTQMSIQKWSDLATGVDQ